MPVFFYPILPTLKSLYLSDLLSFLLPLLSIPYPSCSLQKSKNSTFAVIERLSPLEDISIAKESLLRLVPGSSIVSRSEGEDFRTREWRRDLPPIMPSSPKRRNMALKRPLRYSVCLKV
ncbi:hypothetical protein EVAR_67376_1 [Eumeta japonica]|uniref:Uncharacterized protein n=1 Tax=Eumeta variegata TaxID=151549 RepID=A0A4C2AEX0_EUMVA|nr:hypothetical protein EVAR_67376_1 [Eumeta japonica]